ncbi:aldo/keto reductase [Devosia sp. RR2S18]|uniref:aldo/keto reductase n=1 Tax=Devosia rhizosphaerae TaxID=3049774 RepID=UPI0025411718|nr:aldo/keto reductase [Devosia sp. RR2S18]WIJ26321.1 aldo/keto reductase [Devosia sp. RR2S18]
MAQVPTVALNDERNIPQLGFGVWQVGNDEVVRAVQVALETGYRSIDTAQIYGNEEGVGRAIRNSAVPREEIFITSKLRTSQQSYDDAIRSFEDALQRMGLNYLDLFLIHWPTPAQNKYHEAWKAFVHLQKEGRVRSIGVSNFLPEHLDKIIDETGVAPAVNQIELHPEYQQQDVRDFHQRHQIAIESYSPLGSGALLENPAIGDIARKHGVSPAQVMIRWQIQEGLIVIPKSSNPERIRSNFDVFAFELDKDDLSKIAKLDKTDGKIGSHPNEMNRPF